MNREISLTYTNDLIRYAVRKYWLRTIGLSGFLGFGLLLAGFIYLLVTGSRSWFFGFITACLLIGGGFGIASYFIYLNRSLEKFNRMENGTAKVRFADDRIGIESDLGWTEISWRMIERIWKYPLVWLIFIAKQGYITFPVADLDQEIMEFISLKVKENGGTES